MSGKKILLATDFSSTGQLALKMASTFARECGATLLITHVEEPPIVYGGEYYYGQNEPDRAALKNMLADVKPTDASVPFEHHLLVGQPAMAIVEFAEKQGVEMIVISTHGRTGIVRLLMGSIAEEIVRKATCPVLTVKNPAPTRPK
jgi:nucleotide-binding universal stress UspA family protein